MMLCRKKILPVIFATIIAAGAPALALDPVRVEWTGGASYEFGQVMKGRGADKARTQNDSLLNHTWLQQALGTIGAKAALAPGLELKVGFEFAYVFSYIQSANVLWQSSLTPDTRIKPAELSGSYSLGFPDSGTWAKFVVGYFPFKYNPDVRNLGEYIFRTGTYPGYIMNDFDFPAQRLLGFRVVGGFSSGIFKAAGDALLTSETLYYPLQDFSPTFICRSSVLDAMELGGGICFNRLWSAKEAYTILKSRPFVDSLGDTTYYTFAGTKVMGRIMLDPKRTGHRIW